MSGTRRGANDRLFKPTQTYRLHIEGRVPSKKNRYRVNRFGIGRKLFKDKEVKEYEQHAKWQIQSQWGGKPPITSEMRIRIEFFRSGRMVDDLNAAQTIYDVLQAAGVVKNDVRLVADGFQRIRVNARMDKTIITLLPPHPGQGWIENIS